MVVHPYNPNTQEVEAGSSEVQVIFGYIVSPGQSGLHKTLLVSRGGVQSLEGISPSSKSGYYESIV